MKPGSMRSRLTIAFVFVLAPFLLMSSHILLTIVRRHHMGPGVEPQWPPFVIYTTASLIAFGIAAWFLVGRTLSPIRRLAQQAESGSVENPDVRLVAPSDDAEMRELVDTLNHFLDRMQQAAETKSRFYTTASHELRTPLQALSGHLEVALSQARTAEEYAETLQEAHLQTQRLVKLVEGILLLHHLDGAKHKETESVDLSQALDSEIQNMRPLAEVRGLTLNPQIHKPAVITAVPTHAPVLIRNLVENAVKYAAENGQIDLTITKQEHTITLAITNDLPPGSKLNPDQLQEPFFRPEAVRQSSPSGNGLGLAICRAVCKTNGWTLDLAETPDSRMMVKVTIPENTAKS